MSVIKNKKAFRKNTYSATLSVVVIAVVVVLNLVIGQIPSKYTQFDISVGKLYTVGEETKKLLDSLSEDITIYYVVQSGNEDSNVEKLLDQYEESSSKVTVEKIDPVVNPTFTKDYAENGLNENSIIVSGNGRSKTVDYSNLYETEFDYSTYQQTTKGFDGEGQITSAISYVISEDMPILYYVEGHGEISMPTSLNDRIEKANLELKSLNLVTAETVPQDAAALLLNSPENDYSAEEAQKVISYLQNGGKALILTDYIGKNMDHFDSILEEYGLQVTDGIVVETDTNHYVQQPYYLVPNIGITEVTDGMTSGSANVLLSGCQGLKVAEDARETLEIETVLSPTEDAYVKTSPENMKTYDMEDGDAEGPFDVGVMITENETQIVCFSSSAIMNEQMNSMVSDGNYTLYMNSLSWMVDSDDSKTISIASKSLTKDYLTVSRGKGVLFWFLFGILLPVTCLIIGGVVCHRRKRR